MAEKVEISAATYCNNNNNNNQQNDARKVSRKSPDFQPITPGVISRERSFVRTSNQQVCIVYEMPCLINLGLFYIKQIFSITEHK